MKMITRVDVAKRAGVSVTAVSRVMNNSGYVAREKREAILKAVDDLGYRPSPVAVAMQKRETKQLLFVNKDLSNAYNIDMYRGMLNYASGHGYMMVLSGTWDVTKIKSIMIDGVILPNETMAEDYVEQVKNTLSIPTVCASYGASVERPKRIPFIEADTHVAMERLIDYLFEKGHRKIALATPYPIAMENPRSTAYRSKLLPILGSALDRYVFVRHTKEPIYQTDEEDFFSYGEQLAVTMRESGSDATAVACFNDDMAIGMLNQFRRMGVKVPEELSVAGIDGIDIGKYAYPKLTSISLDPYRQGQECARVLIDLIAGKKVKGRTRIPMKIVEGESVKRIWHDQE